MLISLHFVTLTASKFSVFQNYDQYLKIDYT